MAEWFVLETIRRIHPLHSTPYTDFHGLELRIDTALAFIDRTVHILFNKQQFYGKAREIFAELEKKPEKLIKINQKIIKDAESYLKVSKKLDGLNFSQKTDLQLARLLENYLKAYAITHYGGQIPNLIEFDQELLSNAVKDVLTKKLKEKKLKVSLAEAFNLVSYPKRQTKMQKQEEVFQKLALEVLSKEKLRKIFLLKNVSIIEQKLHDQFPEFYEKLSQHYSKYLWLPFMYEGPAWEKSYFINLLSSIARQKPKIKSLQEKIQEHKKLLKKKQAFLKKIALKGREKKLIKSLELSLQSKAARKEAMYFGCYASLPLFKELAKRMGLSLDQFRYFKPEEAVKAFKTREFDVNELNQRLKFSVYRILDCKPEFIVGERAQRFFYSVYQEEKYTEISELKGSSAFPGQVKGKTSIVNHPNEMFKLEEGDVMVSHSTNPNLVPAMKKASAIITDVGGVTCHAAIVSRELKKPCVIGTKIATKALKDGDLIEVDAEKGVVKIVRRSI